MHLLVQIEFANQFTVHGMNSINLVTVAVFQTPPLLSPEDIILILIQSTQVLRLTTGSKGLYNRLV